MKWSLKQQMVTKDTKMPKCSLPAMKCKCYSKTRVLNKLTSPTVWTKIPLLCHQIQKKISDSVSLTNFLSKTRETQSQQITRKRLTSMLSKAPTIQEDYKAHKSKAPGLKPDTPRTIFLSCSMQPALTPHMNCPHPKSRGAIWCTNSRLRARFQVTAIATRVKINLVKFTVEHLMDTIYSLAQECSTTKSSHSSKNQSLGTKGPESQ